MSLFTLLTVWWLWQAPEPAYAPRPLVSPVLETGGQTAGQRLLFVRESWRGDEVWLRALPSAVPAPGAAAQREIRLWAAGTRVIDEVYWSGSQAVLVKAHGRGHAPALWWISWTTPPTTTVLPAPAAVLPARDAVQVRRLTPEEWPEGGRRGAHVVQVSPAGEVLLSLDRRRPHQPDLYRWSPQRSQPRVVEVNAGNVLGWRSDGQGTPRLRQRYRLAPNDAAGIEYSWEWRQQAYGAWTRLDAWHLDEPAWRPLRFKDRDDLWIYAETPQRDTFALHRLGLLAGAVSAPAVSSRAADMARVWWSAGASQPALVEWHSLLPGQRALLPEWRRWQAQLQQAAHSGQTAAAAAPSHWLIRQVLEDEQLLLAAEIDGRSPQRWWRFHTGNDRHLLLGNSWPPVASGDPASALPMLRALRWTSGDHLPLSAYYQPPADATVPAGKLPPLLVLVHGGPWARDRYDYDPLSAALARQGIGVLKVNFRGSSGLGRGFLMASRGEWGKAMQRDVMEGIQQVARRGWADAGRACIAGMSYGGYAALQAILSQPHHFRCALAHAPVTDLAQHIRWLAKRGDLLGAAEWRALVGDPDTQADVLAAVSPLTHAQRLARPVLLSHGTADGIVDPLQSLQFHARAPAPWLRWLAIDGGHQLESAAQRQQLWNAWQRFLIRYLLSEE